MRVAVAGKIPAEETAQPEITIEHTRREELKKNSLSLQKHFLQADITSCPNFELQSMAPMS